MYAQSRSYMLTYDAMCLDQKLYVRIIEQIRNTVVCLAHTNQHGPQQIACPSCRRDNDIPPHEVP